MRFQRADSSAATPLTKIVDPPASAASPKKPERQRGLWSFLTWSFFLSEVMAAGSFLGKGIGAPQEDEDGVAHATSHSPSDDVPNPAAIRIAAIDPDVQAEEGNAARHNIHAKSVLPLESHSGGEPVTLKASSSDTGQGGTGGGAASGSETIDGTDGLHAGSDGVEVSPDPNLDHLLSDLVPSTGLHADLNQILGFDLHLGSGGSLVGANLRLALDLNPAHLISDLPPTIGIDISVHLKHLLGFDAQLGVDGLFAAHALPDLGDLELPALKSTLAEVTGLQILGGVGDLIIPLGNSQDSDPSAILIKPMDALTGQREDGVTLNASSPPAAVIPLTSGIGLGQNGDISSGDTITFPAQVLAPVDELFSGGCYTDYNVTLQSKITDSGHASDVLNSGIVGNSAAALPSADIPPDSHSAGASPLPGQHDLEASLVQIPTHIEELSLRVHSI
jgi:hypothetical protein